MVFNKSVLDFIKLKIHIKLKSSRNRSVVIVHGTLKLTQNIILALSFQIEMKHSLGY